MIALVVNFEAVPGKGAALREALIVQGKNSLKNEKGCKHFDVCVNPQNDAQFVLYELYENDAALKAHRETSYYLAFRETIGPLVKVRDVKEMVRL
ncbi:MAG: putative quinol monooxygenase [Pseudomonadota bacterium]|nr:putative quinol monooxygenase [Pseudomonadota bacterium]